MNTPPINKVLDSFPTSTVKSTATFYNKAFHAKIFTLFASSESEVFTFSQRHKPHYDFCFGFMKNDEGQWYLDINGIDRVRAWVVEESKSGTQSIFSLFDSWSKDWEDYLALCKKVKSSSLSVLSNSELYDLFEQFYYYYLRVGSIAYIADSFMSTGTEDWLETLLSDELEKKGMTSEKNIDAVRKLTSPVHFSFTIEAEHELLQIAYSLVSTYSDKLPAFDDLDDKTQLQEMEAAYHWIQNNYYNVHYITAAEFYEQVKKIILEAGNDAGEVKRILDEKQSNLDQLRSDREKMISSLGLSSFSQNLLEVARLFAKWKDDRKSGVYIGMYYFDKFLSEVSNRMGISVSDVNYLVFDEIKGVFLEKNDMKEIVEQRKQQCFFAITPNGYYIVQGKDADEYFQYLPTDSNTNVTEIKGVVASPGHARGRVRIIRKTYEMADFKTGEILVTNQTTPEFVPIMKKAAAIVTEQGGITSHAAIVSREMKKPCVIGTKIATSALLNGEVVEVDAHNGIVRRTR